MARCFCRTMSWSVSALRGNPGQVNYSAAKAAVVAMTRALAKEMGEARGRPVGLYPETKHPGYFRSIGLPLETPLLAALHGAGFTSREDPVWIQSFEVENLRLLREATDLRLVQLAAPGGGPADRPGLPYDAMMTPEGFIFVSSPEAVTPFHFDPEHNILLQLQGSKVMTQFPAGDPRYAPDEVHESYHLGGPRELPWDDALLAGGTPFAIEPGEAVYVPVMAPHFVRNGPAPSLSLSITWRSEWSYAEAGSRCFNGLVRKLGVSPRAPGRWPANNQVKSLAFRAWRKATGVFG